MMDTHKMIADHFPLAARRLMRDGECLLWSGAYSGGQCVFTYKQVRHALQRSVWERLIGPIPEGCDILRTCGNPRCAEPTHLTAIDSKLARCKERTPERDRFWSKVDRGDSGGGCWIWTGATNAHGYGVFQPRSREFTGRLAHRYSWWLHSGGDPGDLDVCHRCDNPPCVNPDHLFLGTAKDNMQDCKRKGRNNRGSRNGQAILCEIDVLEIRDRAAGGERRADLAAEYGVGYQAVVDIVLRRNWRHI